MNFIPNTDSISHTNDLKKCFYCNEPIYSRNNKTYSLNKQSICWSCLTRYAKVHNIKLSDLRKTIKEMENQQ